MRAVTGRRVITTVDELLDPVRSARMEPMITRAGTLRVEFISVDLGNATVETVEYSVPVISKGMSAADRIAVVIPIAARLRMLQRRTRRSGRGSMPMANRPS